MSARQVFYTSAGEEREATLCAPSGAAGLPLLMHLPGDPDAADGERCRELAARGFAVATVHPPPEPELCRGEVEDALALRRVALNELNADVRQVAYLGEGLGSCPALRAAAQDPTARALALLPGALDLAAQVEFLRDNDPVAFVAWTGTIGGSPEEAPAAYAERDVRPQLNALPPKLLLIAHDDPGTPAALQCEVLAQRRAERRRLVVVRGEGEPCANEVTLPLPARLRGSDLLVLGPPGEDQDPHNLAVRYLADNIVPSPMERLRSLRLPWGERDEWGR